ncbi:DUF5805 domain-containing protein [Halosegnis sp.]|uniref:DUF5805 domain-containing protein n=1 Tax=Halosegnis sp. TaxID=2864959 RepID=UPI0035D47523
MSDSETERVGVRTYVPRYQKERWEQEAAELDMSQAEFVRTMVQAGRRGFGLEAGDEGKETSDETNATPGVDGVKDRLLGLLESEGALSWDDLVAGLTDDVEARLDDALDDLQAANRVKYSGRAGGYTLVDDGE